MGLIKNPFIVCQQFMEDTDIITINDDMRNEFIEVLTVTVCVKDPKSTRIKLDSTVELVRDLRGVANNEVESQIDYRLTKNGTPLATQSDIVTLLRADTNRINTIDGLTWCDENPSAGDNVYTIEINRVDGGDTPEDLVNFVEVQTRALNATVFPK
ncbi:hypothetical protein [Chengkuizengella axinellae]|uniref:Uncharacterized protein n=1 Tax=Chengkuizengella axinellae TaxID=3064388 RepID=A0ABT9IYS8_9BACL|nr:hypothetical protein [Chengkuizengella sp. 2205SS18-9]MDP5274519.1 hypothetical protein [Chengkuizengella sp. 2205SS18-9]